MLQGGGSRSFQDLVILTTFGLEAGGHTARKLRIQVPSTVSDYSPTHRSCEPIVHGTSPATDPHWDPRRRLSLYFLFETR
jgi:hypothetical protein